MDECHPVQYLRHHGLLTGMIIMGMILQVVIQTIQANQVMTQS